VAAPKKYERFMVKPFANSSGSTSWRVTGYWPDGKRERKNFAHKNAALEYRAKISIEAEGAETNYQLQRTSLTREQLADAESAMSLAKGEPLAQIVGHYRKLENDIREHTKLTLDQAAHFLAKHYKPEIEDVSIATAVARFIESRGTHAEKTVGFYTTCLRLFQRLDPNTLVHQIGLRTIESCLAKYKNVNTQKTYRRGLNAFLNWCVRHHYALENPCSRLDRLPADTSQVAILSLEEAKRLLRAAMLYQEGVMVPVVAIGLFAGLRPSEIQDLDPKNIKEDYIVVTGGKLRRKMNRRVPLPDRLKVWLMQYPFVGIPDGIVYKMKVLKEAAQAEKWVQDIIRHTSISFQLERDQDEARTAFNNGTSRTMIERHYRDVVEDPKHVQAYWALTPESLKSIRVELPTGQGIDKWPTDVQLVKLVFEKPLTRIAADLGVSDNAVRKRCLKRGIELPRNGYWQRVRAHR
jgi:integrase